MYISSKIMCIDMENKKNVTNKKIEDNDNDNNNIIHNKLIDMIARKAEIK